MKAIIIFLVAMVMMSSEAMALDVDDLTGWDVALLLAPGSLSVATSLVTYVDHTKFLGLGPLPWLGVGTGLIGYLLSYKFEGGVNRLYKKQCDQILEDYNMKLLFRPENKKQHEPAKVIVAINF